MKVESYNYNSTSISLVLRRVWKLRTVVLSSWKNQMAPYNCGLGSVLVIGCEERLCDHPVAQMGFSVFYVLYN